MEGVERFHEPKASFAESSARSMSSGEETGASPNASPVLGSTSGRSSPRIELFSVDKVVQFPHCHIPRIRRIESVFGLYMPQIGTSIMEDLCQ